LSAIFEEPTVARLAVRVRSAIAGSETAGLALTRVSRDGPIPLSFAERRLWFLDQLTPGTATWNMSSALRLRGPLDVHRVERALVALVTRHETLRTRYVTTDGDPVRVIDSPSAVAIDRLDLQASADAPAQATTLRKELEATPFDLAAGPLFRATLMRLGPDDHVLSLRMHHIVSDGLSLGVLIRDWAALYRAEATGEPLPPLAIQYADFAAWERAWLHGDRLERQLGYWREHLSGVPVLELPTDRPRAAVKSVEGAVHTFVLDARLVTALETLARRDGGTLFVMLLAACSAVLGRYTRQTDFALGTLVARRTHVEVEQLVGFFVSNLAMRVDLSGAPNTRSLIRRLRDATLAAFAHQDVPFERIVEDLQSDTARDMSRTPIFQVMLALQNVGSELPTLPGLKVDQLLWRGRVMSEFDMKLMFTPTPDGGLHAAFEYTTALFDASRLERFEVHLRTLMEAMVAEPETPVFELPMLGASEAETIARWQAVRADFPADRCIHELFEDQAARTPDNIAVVFEREELSYCILNARANQLARRLREMGARTHDIVALRLERTPRMVVAVLAILKAGAAYLPIDAAAPVARVSSMLRDSGATILVTTQSLAEGVECQAMLAVDVEVDAIGAHGTENLGVALPPSSLAYVIYTSGSTGQPKGSPIAHANVVRLMRATQPWFGFDSNDVWTIFHSVAFDFSVWEMWGALLYGGCVVVISSLLARSAEDFLNLLIRRGVTVLCQTPAAFQHLKREVLSRDAVGLALRYVIFGGEALDIPSVSPWFERLGDAKPVLVNMYGITETTVHVTYRPLGRLDAVRASNVIGHAIPDLRVSVLDGRGRVAPIGVPGELYVGGRGLSRGYLNRPALTAERFVPDPHVAEPGARMYRSGDLARWQADGGLDYLGRLDNQVKIRGFRIELGEIESTLLAQPDVSECIVLVHDDKRVGKRLVAFVVPEGVPPRTLQEGLRAKLPEYMVPASFVGLEALPLTPNGKIDRKRLLDLAARSERGAPAPRFVPPQSPVEERVARIWSEVIGVDRVGSEDNFFELGGHSLMAAQVLARVRRELEVFAPLRMLFETPTLAGFSAALEAIPQNQPARIRPIHHGGRLPLSFPERTIYGFERRHPGSSAWWNNPLALRLRGPIDLDALHRATLELFERNEVLRTRIRLVSDVPMQFIEPFRVDDQIEMVDLSSMPDGARDEEAMRTIRALTALPVPLVDAPLAYAKLFCLRPNDHIFFFRAHHAAFDGESYLILIRDLVGLYGAFASGSPLPDAWPIQYADFTLCQSTQLETASLKEELAYWSRQLAGARPIALPYETASPAESPINAAPIRIRNDLLALLDAVAAQEAATRFIAVLAVLDVFLSQLSGQTDLCVVSPSNARFNSPELARTMGYLMNQTVLRVDLSGDPSVREIVRRARRVTVEAHSHGTAPAALVLGTESPLDHPLSSVVYNVIPVAPGLLTWPGVGVQWMQTPIREDPKVPLALVLTDHSNLMDGALAADARLFSPKTVTEMGERLMRLLSTSLANPDLPLSALR
jgi:amino acid adenylation domain-containing protein